MCLDMFGIHNVWLYFVSGYGLIWAGMLWANKKRGKPIEAPENYENYKRIHMIVMGYLPPGAVLLGSVFVPVSGGLLFWSGIVVFIVGVILNLTALYSFSQCRDGVNSGGIYRFSRNPMYVGAFLFIAGLNVMGWSVSLSNIVFWIVSLLWIGTIHWNVIQEERFLLGKYGIIFEEYRSKVPRYLGIRKKPGTEK